MLHPILPTHTVENAGDEEIYKKLGEITKRLNQAYQQGNMSMVQQLQMLSENYTEELRERMIIKMTKEESPICVETDPDMIKLNQKEMDQIRKKKLD